MAIFPWSGKRSGCTSTFYCPWLQKTVPLKQPTLDMFMRVISSKYQHTGLVVGSRPGNWHQIAFISVRACGACSQVLFQTGAQFANLCVRDVTLVRNWSIDCMIGIVVMYDGVEREFKCINRST